MSKYLVAYLCLLSSVVFATGQNSPAPNCDWPSVNHDLKNSRNNPCVGAINKTNVGTLQQIDSFSTATGIQVAPVIQNNVIYFGDLAGNVYARVATDLSIPIWTVNIGSSISAPATVTATTVYVATSNLSLHALDINTGAELAGFPVIIDPAIAATGLGDVLAGPVVTNGLVIIPTTNGGGATATNINPQNHGSINAFNADTGAFVWRTVIQPAPKGAQGGSFSTAAVDVKRNLLFIGTSNGDNEPSGKRTDALLALDITTGKIKWSEQYTKDDVWGALYPEGLDYDVGASPNLFKAGSQAVVGASSKKGTYKVFTRGSGNFIWERNILPKNAVPVATAAPGAAYDKNTGTIYAPALFDNSGLPLNVLTILYLNGNADAGNAVINSYFNTNQTSIAALDNKSGKIKWRQVTTGATSGSLTSANGIVYHANWRGEIRAYDGETGEVLLLNNTSFPFPTILGAPITVVNDRVYITSGITAFLPGKLVVLGLPGS